MGSTTIGNAGVTFPDATVQPTAALLNTVNAGTGISVSATTGNPTITNTGVTSMGAGGGISVSAATGGVTVTNTGVTSMGAGGGISVSAATGGVTVTNTGVTSIVAGTNITISGATGAVTINAAGGSPALGSIGAQAYGATLGDIFSFCTYGTVVAASVLNTPDGQPGQIGLSGLVGTWQCNGAFTQYQGCPISAYYFITGTFTRIA